MYAPEASNGFRITNNSLAFPSIDELKENLSVKSKMHEPYTKLNLTNKRGLGGMKKPEASSVSPRDSNRSGRTAQAFHQTSGDLSLTD